jgi:hypothetical protein
MELKILEPNNLLLISNIIILISLIPSLISKQKPHQLTSALQVFLYALFIYVYYQLGLLLLILGNIIIAIEWIILFFQKFREGRLTPKRKQEIFDDIIKSIKGFEYWE